jgi:hypothetical protein
LAVAVAVALLSLVGVSSTAGPAGAPVDNLERDFRNPPIAARPYVWWHWMGPNFSKEGITKDLEAMKAAGIGGATIFNLTSAVQESHAPTENNPWPDQTYRSPKYWEALRHAAAEADRLGLELGLHNTVGYSTTGGPWIDEERSMQRLVWSSATVAGGAAVVVSLPMPAIPLFTGWGKTGRELSFFRDVAVLAVPAERPEISLGDVIDLSGRLSPAGELRWEAPRGNWIVYRLGHASTGAAPHPVPDDVLGRALEADKLSLTQTRFHWETVIAPLRQQLGPLYGRSFRHFLIDSYEAGYQSWTPGVAVGRAREAGRRAGPQPALGDAGLRMFVAGVPIDRAGRRPAAGADVCDGGGVRVARLADQSQFAGGRSGAEALPRHRLQCRGHGQHAGRPDDERHRGRDGGGRGQAGRFPGSHHHVHP